MERLKLNIQKFASGTITFANNGSMSGKIEWSSTVVGSTAQEKATNNKSNVTAIVYVRRNDGYSTWGTFSGGVTINGTSQNFSPDLNVSSNWVEVGRKTVVVQHNQDGSKSITISGWTTGPTETTWAGKTVSGSGTAVLDKIPRYATCNQSLKSKTEISITMNWSSDSTIDRVWYSTNNGSSWSSAITVNAKSGSYTISGLTANTTYNIKTRVRRKDSQLTTDSSKNAIATYNYPNCTLGTNFTIGNSVTLQFYNPLNRTFKIQMWSYASETFMTDQIEISGTSYTFTPNANILYASIPNNKSSEYTIDSLYGNNKITKWNCGTYSENETTNAPTFNNFDYEDIDSTTLALTGDSSIIVQNYSDIKATITAANKATAKNNAVMKQYRMVIGNQTSATEIDTYKCVTANALLCQLSNRNYYKTTDDLAFVGYYYGGEYTGPILVGTTADSVKFTSNGNEFSGSTYTYQGQTYYVSSTAYFMAGNQTSTNGIATKLSSDTLTTQQAIEIMLDKLIADSQNIILPTLSNATTNLINLYAEDSRGIATLVSKTATFKAYTDIQKNNINVERQNNVGEAVTLTFNGTYWNENFGSVTNSITNVRYRYKKTSDSDYSGWNGTTIITPTTNGNNYSFSGGIAGDLGNTGFSAENSFNIEVEVFDELSSTVFSFTLGTGTPWIAVADEGIAIKAPYNENLGGKLQVNGYVIDKIGTLKESFGDIFISDGTYTGTLYSHLVGKYIGNGIWEISVDGQLAYSNGGSNYFNWGLSITKISSLLGLNLVNPVSGFNLFSSYLYYNSNGEMSRSLAGYGPFFEYHSDLNRLMPARIYNTSGSIGGWPLNAFSSGNYLQATIYLKEQ